MMMLKRIVSIIAVTLIMFNTTVFCHTGIIDNSGANKYKAIRLSPEIYNYANKDLSDILIKDDNGENVSYFINTSYQKIYKDDYLFKMSQIDYYVKNEAFYFDYKIEDTSDKDIFATSMEIVTKNENFAKNIELFGSYDSINWQKVQDDIIYSVEQFAKFEIKFEQPRKFTHYRFKLDNNLEKITFDSVYLKHSVKTIEENYFIESLKPKFRVEEKDKNTYIFIEGLKNLRLNQFSIESDSFFIRNISLLGKTKDIYNYSINGKTCTDLSVPLDMSIASGDELIAIINNNDDKPINIKGVYVEYYADELVFDGSNARSFSLSFGEDKYAKAPVYDIALLKDEILKGDIDKLIIKDITIEKPITIEEPYDFSIIFNVAIVAVAIILGIVILLKLKKI